MIISSKNERSLDNPLILIDDDEKETPVLCAEIPTHSSEFYKAGQQGIRRLHTLIINSDEYHYEEKCKYDDIRYQIYRFYPMDDGFTELYIGQRIGGV